ncbi:MAG: hypothetical protein ACT4OM_13665 [Actinomycetota bacterium]
MSKVAKQPTPHDNGLDHDFLVSFLEIDPDAKAAILGLAPPTGIFAGRSDGAICDEQVELLRTVEQASDEDIVALTGLYAQIDSWSEPPPPATRHVRRRDRRDRRTASRNPAVALVGHDEQVFRKAATRRRSAVPPLSLVTAANPGSVPIVRVDPEVDSLRTMDAAVHLPEPAQTAGVSYAAPPEPVRAPQAVVQPVEVLPAGSVMPQFVQIEPQVFPPDGPPAEAPPALLRYSRAAEVSPFAASSTSAPSALALPGQPAPRLKGRTRRQAELVAMAARAEAGYATWLAVRGRYAMQWDYMNFDFAPPPPPPRTIREARRQELKTMVKYYRINTYKAHAREDRRQTKQILARARRTGLQSA